MISKTDPAVLIVGGGPCGLVLALTLRQNGIPIRIIDKASSSSVGQRGSGIMPRTMEIYRCLGVLPDILKLFIPVPHIRTCEPGKGVDKVVSVFPMFPYMVPTPDQPYLNPAIVAQSRVQGILREHLKEYGCQVEFGTELKSLEQSDDGVVAHLTKTEDGMEINEDVRVRYLVGADGGRGIVRKQIGLSFTGVTREGEHWVFADVQLNKEINHEFWDMWGDFQNGFVTIRPTEAHANNEFWVSIGGRDIDWLKLSTNPEEFANTVRELSGLHALEFKEFFTLEHYKINIRSVDKLGQGRVFVAGDAAHIHSFTGGQGMNTGVSDAFNLAWKLALAVKSLSSSRLLETYTSERIPIIEKTLENSTKILVKTIERTSEALAGDLSYRHGLDLFQLQGNYIGSPVVFDELDSQSDNHGKRVRAGSRAPNAPGLVPLMPGLKPGSSEVFDTFSPSRHTALVFARNDEDVTPYTSALGEYPTGTMYTVVVLPKGHSSANDGTPATKSGMMVVLDSQEYCWTAYPASNGAKVVIVRPDGYIGAIAQSVKGIGRYRELVFDADTNQ